MTRAPSRPPPSESDVNISHRRARWQATRPADSLLARDEKAFLHQSVSSPCLGTVTAAGGIWLTDGQGHRVMDFHGNNVHHIGYGHPRLKAAITAQMEALPFAPRRFASEKAVELAEKLGRITPGNLSKVLLATGGSDAVEMALKLARAATGRFKTLSFWDAFHGAGFGASSVGGEALFRGPAIGPLLPGAEHVAPFACYRCPYGHAGPDRCGLACAAMIDYVLEREGDVAAVIAEPMRAVPYLPPPGFWRQVREACDRHDTLLIFDEIPTGLGKTGRLFACEHDGVTPDILVLGKGLGGGILPLAAIVARPELDMAGDYALGHYTHEKNPVLARAALETIAIIEDEDLVANAAAVGTHALERLHAMQECHETVGDVRGAGFLIGIELVSDRATRMPAPGLAEAVLYAAYDRGLSFKLTMGNVITLTPPLVTTRAQMDAALDIIDECLRELA